MTARWSAFGIDGHGPETASDIGARLRDLGIELPRVFPPAGNYVSAARTGTLLNASGAGPVRPDGSIVTGKVGTDIDLESAVEAARLTGPQLLAALAVECGSLNRITRIVKTFGMVNCASGLNRTPQVIDGCSNLFVEVFGEAGRSARYMCGLGRFSRMLPPATAIAASENREWSTPRTRNSRLASGRSASNDRSESVTPPPVADDRNIRPTIDIAWRSLLRLRLWRRPGNG